MLILSDVARYTPHMTNELFVSSKANNRSVEIVPMPSSGTPLNDDALNLAGKPATDMELTNQNKLGIPSRT